MTRAALPAGWPAMSIAQAHAALTAPGSPLEMETRNVRGVELRVWKNLPPTLRSLVEAARVHGDRTFLVYEDERVTYEAFYRAVSAFARELQARGVIKGDRVAVIMRNLPEWAVAFYGAAVLGAIVTPLNAWGAGEELQFGLTDSGSGVVILDSERYQRLVGRLRNCPDLRHVYVCREIDEIAHPLVTKLEAVIGAPEAWAQLPDRGLPPVELETDDDATIFYTSGTTGKPKGALATHRAVNSNIMAAAVSQARSFLRRGEPAPTPQADPPQRTALMSVPFFHVTGCLAILNPSLAKGAKLVIMRKWDVVRAFELIARERIQAVGGVPAIAWQLIEHPDRLNYDLSSLESVAYGGAPAAPDLVHRITETFPASAAGITWGMTETCVTVTHHGAEDYANRPMSCGPAVPVSDLEVRAPDDGRTVLGPDQIGELWAKGPQVARNYWNQPDATARTFVDGWVRTGDLARIDAEGFCFIVDRLKDMLIRGGENIYCIEVENVLHDHPAVMDAAIIGIPHRILGEEPAAVVSLKPGASATEDELRGHVARRLAAFKVPVSVQFWLGPLPRNANGKVLKADLKMLFQDRPTLT